MDYSYKQCCVSGPIFSDPDPNPDLKILTLKNKDTQIILPKLYFRQFYISRNIEIKIYRGLFVD